jgi:hypothetical protein
MIWNQSQYISSFEGSINICEHGSVLIGAKGKNCSV